MAHDFNSSDVVSFGKVASGLGDHFEGGMRASDHRRLVANYAETTAPLQDRVVNMENNLMRLQSQDLAYRRAQLTFKEEKEKRRKQREFSDSAINQRVHTIMAGEDTALEKRNQIQELGANNPQALLHSPLFTQTYNSALNRTKTLEQMEKPVLEEGATTVGAMLLNTPSAEAHRVGAKVLSGEVSVAEGIEARAAYMATAREAKSQGEITSRKDAILKADLAVIANPKVDTFMMVSSLDEALQADFDNLETREEKQEFLQEHRPTTRFTEAYREDLIEILADSSSLTEDDVRREYPVGAPDSDMSLRAAAKDAVDGRRVSSVGVGREKDLYDTKDERDIAGAIMPPKSPPE